MLNPTKIPKNLNSNIEDVRSSSKYSKKNTNKP